MRWVPLLLVLPAFAGGYYVATKLRVRCDRQGVAGATLPPRVEKLVRAWEQGGPVPAALFEALSDAERKHPWVDLVVTDRRNDADARRQAFAQAHAGTAVGARALALWVRRARGDPAAHAARRAVFRAAYPQSWLLRAWDAKAPR